MIINIYVNKYLCKWKYLCIWKMTSNTFSICTVKHPPPLHESALNNCLSVFCNPCCVPRWCWWPSRRCWASPPYVCTPWGRRPPRGWFLDRRYVQRPPFITHGVSKDESGLSVSHPGSASIPTAQRLHPGAAVCQSWVCTREAGCCRERGNHSKRNHNATLPGCEGIASSTYVLVCL